MRRALELAAGGLLVLAFTASFVAFGGRTLAWAVLGSAAACALAAALLALGDWRDARRMPSARKLLVPAAALVGLALLGAVPLPHAVSRALSPTRARIQEAVPPGIDSWPDLVARNESVADLLAQPAPGAPFGHEAPELDAAPGPHALSHDAARTRYAAPVLACFLVLLVVLSARDDERVGSRVLVAALAVTSAGAAYALWAARATPRAIYGVFEPPAQAAHDPYGTFWNANHFAGACAIVLPLAFALALSARTRLWRGLALAAAAVLALAVADAGSRGGLLAAGAGTLALGVALLLTPGRRGAGAALAGAALIGVVAAFTVLSERILHETVDETTALAGSNELRLRIYKRQLQMLGSAPLTGIGLGAFPTAHSVFKLTPEPLVPHHGESDWFESAAELGLPGIAAWIVLLAGLLGPPLRLAVRGRSTPILSASLAGSLAAVLLAAVGFHHREPAVAIVSVLLAAVAHAGARRIDREAAPVASVGAPRSALPVALAVAALCALAVTAVVARGRIAHDAAARAGERALDAGDAAAAVPLLERATSIDPAPGDAWSQLARAHEMLAAESPPGEARDGHRRAALAACVEALRRSPATLGAARRAGSLLLAAGAEDEAAEAARLALVVSPGNPTTRLLVGRVLLLQGRGPEALGHFAFAYEGTDAHARAGATPSLARWIREAGGGDPRVIFGTLRREDLRVGYLHALARAGGRDELGPYLELLAEEGRFDNAYLVASLLHLAEGTPEATRLAQLLLPHADDLRARTAIGRTLLRGGEREAALRVLSEVARQKDAPAEARQLLESARSAER